ncbi:uncharacterized protein [Amphiura filiformis]
MNAHWQRYDAQREEYVQKLTRTNQELQDKAEDLQKLVDELLDKCERSSENMHHHDHYASSSPEVSSTSPEPSSISSSRLSRKKTDADDELVMLREQINLCVEDFKQERNDRERIHSENQRLRERLAQTEQIVMKNDEQMFVYQEQIKRLQERCQLRPVPRLIPRHGYDEPCCFPEDRPQIQKMSPNNTRQTFRHPVYFGDDLTDLPSDVEIDGMPDEPEDEPDCLIPPTKGAEALIPTIEGAHLSRYHGNKKEDGVIRDDDGDDDDDDEPLQCPRCLASFSITKHADLLDHINICME